MVGHPHETLSGQMANETAALRVADAFLRPATPVFTDIHGLCAATVRLKLEGLNAAGSIKLKPALQLIEDLEAKGRIRDDTQLIESSSGNLGVALAMVCANRGYRFTCVTDPNTSQHAVRTMQALGARVVRVDRRDAQGGFLATRIAWIREQVAGDDRWLWVNQYANPSNWRAHYRWTAPEIFTAFKTVDHLFIGAGTTGTLMGCLRYVRANHPKTRVIAVDTVGSVTFGEAPGRRHIPGLGTSRRPELCDPSLPDAVVHVPEIDTVRMCHALARRGYFAGGSTGSVLCAVQREAARIDANDTVVAIAPDMGDKYLDGVYDADWIQRCFPQMTGTGLSVSHAIQTVCPALP
ncbi:2,3-diaminopropionate biosynthesis protein SbnA [Pandoraea norimbergensis]|uniref:2,3-diaminopropionate biosynthesis protein SbnA n=1 Tax=Pandoraea norimbergensis TaxID=93219 RepID=UPI000AF21870|nr:2,3-diaminopropionate biosynthesis protein SbnA [Pandoraea norimbergensis]